MAEIDEGRGYAPHPVVGTGLVEKRSQRLIRGDTVGLPVDQHLVLRDGLAHRRGTGLLVHLRELLLACEIVRVELGGNLQCQDRAFAVLQVLDRH